MEHSRRLAATICLVLHVLLAAAGPGLDARAHIRGADRGVAVSAASGHGSGTLLHAELCGLCRTLQQIDVPPAATTLQGVPDDSTQPSLVVAHVSVASAHRTSSLGARAPPA